MPQCFWSIPNPSGPPYQVGMYHGDNSGHLILYSGQHILRISFKVDRPLSHSFYLGDHLYEFQMSNAQKAWDYHLTEKKSGRIIMPSSQNTGETEIISDKWLVVFISVIALLFILAWFMLIQ